MNRTPVLGLAVLAAALLSPAPILAQTAAAAGATQPTAKAAAASVKTKKPVPPSRKALRSEALGLALATEVTEAISESQLAISSRVLTGVAQCEFNQTVSIDPVQDKPGYFRVAFNKAVYTMTPQETTTGAVRLEDKRNGIVWLQIPIKSMMMNQKVGQRMVDDCTQAEQRAAVAAAQSTARTK